jgi:hypothetical protein
MKQKTVLGTTPSTEIHDDFLGGEVKINLGGGESRPVDDLLAVQVPCHPHVIAARNLPARTRG